MRLPPPPNEAYRLDEPRPVTNYGIQPKRPVASAAPPPQTEHHPRLSPEPRYVPLTDDEQPHPVLTTAQRRDRIERARERGIHVIDDADL